VPRGRNAVFDTQSPQQLSFRETFLHVIFIRLPVHASADVAGWGRRVVADRKDRELSLSDVVGSSATARPYKHGSHQRLWLARWSGVKARIAR